MKADSCTLTKPVRLCSLVGRSCGLWAGASTVCEGGAASAPPLCLLTQFLCLHAPHACATVQQLCPG